MRLKLKNSHCAYHLGLKWDHLHILKKKETKVMQKEEPWEAQGNPICESLLWTLFWGRLYYRFSKMSH